MGRQKQTLNTCPLCQGALQRVPRLRVDHGQRDAETGRSLRRYRCGSLSCGWQGLLVPSSPPRLRRSAPHAAPVPAGQRVQAGGDAATGTTGHDGATGASAWRLPRAVGAVPWGRVGGVALAAGLMLLVGAQGLRVLMAPGSPRAEGQRLAEAALPVVAPGETHDGEALPDRHPWLQPVVFEPAAAASRGAAAAASGASAAALSPLAMRRNCAWGKPGGNPYRGTVEQALVHARLPAEVVAEISDKVRRRAVADRLEIRTGRIHGVKHGREFDPNRMAMSFGHTLCLNSRVNFTPDHTEAADLYEATDRRGRRHAVMVPDVCGNVTVLGERGERRRKLTTAGGGEAATTQVAADDPGTDEWTLLASGAVPGGYSVPEPGSLGLVGLSGLALGALAWRSRRRSSAGPR